MDSESKSGKTIFYKNMRHFPTITEGKLNIVQFIEATEDLITFVDLLGKSFIPVKYDMQGNVDKIKSNYTFNENSCMFDLMNEEVDKGLLVTAEGILWLNRALLFFEISFQEVIRHIQENNVDVSMKAIFTKAYECSVKQYHNWMVQKLFTLICKMSPTLPHVLKLFEVKDDVKDFENALVTYKQELQLVRTAIDDFFTNRNLFCKP